MHEGVVQAVLAGRIALLGGEVESAFVKSRIAGPCRVGPEGLAGDEQADRTVHGGPDKAVYAYPVDHYADWCREFPEHADLWGPGALGENLAIGGLTETDVCPGDVHRIGSVLLQVCQPRQPCFKLALRFGNRVLPRAMLETGRSGWYYRVLQTGQVEAGDTVVLVERPNPDFPFDRLARLRADKTPERALLERMCTLEGLAKGWQDWAAKKLHMK